MKAHRIIVHRNMIVSRMGTLFVSKGVYNIFIESLNTQTHTKS